MKPDGKALDARVTHTVVVDTVQQELDYLARVVERLEEKMPSDEDLAYLARKREEDDRAAWAWKMIRLYVPWITAVCSAVGTAVYWIVTHFQVRQP